MRPCLPSSACSPLPATAFINSDYFSPVNCPVRVTGWEPRAGAWSSDLRGKRPSLPLLQVGVEEEGTALAETRDDRSIFPAAR